MPSNPAMPPMPPTKNVNTAPTTPTTIPAKMTSIPPMKDNRKAVLGTHLIET